MRPSRSLTARRIVAVLGAILLAPAAALAHGALKSSQPASGAHLAAVPPEIRLDFTEGPELSLSRVELRDATGALLALGPLAFASDSRRSLVAPIQGALAAGKYTVSWVFVGSDGHPVRGSFEFIIVPGATGTASASSPGLHHDPISMPEGTGFGVESPAYVAVRWLLFAGILVVVGAVAFRYGVLHFLMRREQLDEGRKRHAQSATVSAMRERAAAAGAAAALGVLLALLLRLLAQSYALHGSEAAWSAAQLQAMVVHTTWGWAWVAQLGGALAAILGFRSARRGQRAGWSFAAAGALMLAFTPAFSGHAVAAPRLTALAILADGIHVIAAGGWLGSLLMVIGVGLPAIRHAEETRRGQLVAELVNAFSPTALLFAGLLGATGVFAAWLHLGGLAPLWESSYGRTLLIKLGILSVVAATGAYNWLRVRPTLGDIEGARRIRRSSTVELAVGLVVLLVTAVLVATPPPMEMQATGGSRVSIGDGRTGP